MTDNYNNGNIEQVPKDIFGINEFQPQSQQQPDNKTAVAVNERSGTKKTSFAELRHGRKVPRLKKSMVLTIITGGVFGFLLLVNLIAQKMKDDEKKYFNEQNNIVATGSEFSLGDMENRTRYNEVDQEEIIYSDENYFRSPPAYTPVQTERVMIPPSGDGPPRSVLNSGYSDNDLLAIRAQIGKEGGYGKAWNANYISQDNYNIAGANTPAAFAYTGQMPTQEEYTRQRMDEISQLIQMNNNNNNNNKNNTRYTEAGRYYPNNPVQGGDLALLNDSCLFPGTIIHAILVSRIDTDYPGPIHARVIENIYDSRTGKNLLIPQGTILQGNYSSSSIGVSKVQIAWESMVVNYQGVAYQVSLGGMAGVDKRGRAGIAGTLDDHYFEWLKAAGIVSLFTMLNSEIAYQSRNQNNPQVRELMDINQGVINQLGNKLIERALDIQPTVRIANGTAVSVAVNTVVNLRPFPAIRAEERWTRK